MTPILEASGVSVRFGGVVAVDNVSLSVEAGEIYGLIGPNGSGKTTLLNAITGVVSAEGDLHVSGQPVPLGRPVRSRRAGVLRVFQAPQIFAELSGLENVLLATDQSVVGLGGAWLARPLMWRRERPRWSMGRDALDRVGLSRLGDTSARLLTYGQQRLLELARALAAGPEVILLDEPSAGLNDAETAALADLFRSLRDEGFTLAVVDHKIDFIDSICDRISVLELGQVIAVGRPEEVWASPRVVEAYLGESDDA